jgi:type VI secretion system secreted protein Hcp
MAQFDYFLKLEGVKGESQSDRHKDEIDVLSFSWGVSQTGTFAHGGGGGEGKASFHDFHFTTKVSKASPTLFLDCASGMHIKEAVVVGETSSDVDRGASQFFKYTFSDVIISSYQDAGSGGGEVIDSAALSYRSVKVEAAPGVRVDISAAKLGNLMLDAKTGQVIVTESPSGLLVSGPSLGGEGGSGFNRGVVEYALTDFLGVITGPGPCALMLDIREVRQPSEIIGGDPAEELPDARRSPPGPVKKLSRHDVYWYESADLELTAEDFSRKARLLGSVQVDPSDPSGAAMSFDLCEIVQERGLDTIGIRVQSAMDHTSLMEEEGLTTPPDPESGPPFTISPATFMLDLSLELN